MSGKLGKLLHVLVIVLKMYNYFGNKINTIFLDRSVFILSFTFNLDIRYAIGLELSGVT
jgi:hypothetical protein